MLVNTSFNVHEEPIVNKPSECVKALLDGRIDFIVTAKGILRADCTAPESYGGVGSQRADNRMSRTKNDVSTPTAVIQVKSGIGDVIWHLPFVRAIAAASPGSQVTFLAPPSSGAQELLTAETCVAETIYFDHGGSELRRGINLLRLAALLRRGDFRTVWILDRTLRPAVAALARRCS